MFKNKISIFNILISLIILSVISVSLISFGYIFLILIIIIIYSRINLKKLFERWFFILTGLTVILITGYYFQNSMDWRLPAIKYFFLIIISKIINVAIPADCLYSIIFKYINLLPLNSERKNTLFTIFSTSYSAITSILLSNKIKFIYKNNFTDSVIEYMRAIEIEIDTQFDRQKNIIELSDFKLYSSFDISIIIIIILGWIEIEYSVFCIL